MPNGTQTQLVAKIHGSRRWSFDANGRRTSVARRYLIVREDLPNGTMPKASEIGPDDVSGLPENGSAYDASTPDLVVNGYSFEEGEGNDKRKVFCDVTWSVKTSQESEANRAPRGQPVERWGWKSGSVARDLVHDAGTGKLIVNTAGQPFDSVPQIDHPAPVFEKIFKTTSRQSGFLAHYGKINGAVISIGGLQILKHCARCVQCDEERLWNDDDGYKYRYSIGIQIISNLAKVGGAQQETDIGWDIALVSTGTMEIPGGSNYTATPVMVVSAETGQPMTVTGPVLLDGNGKAMLNSATAEPYAIRVQAYAETTFPTDFYSEPV